MCSWSINLSEFEYFRVLDANAYVKLHRVLVSYLGKCTQYMVEEIMCFNRDLVREFCEATLTEYAKLSMKDQFYKVNVFSLSSNLCHNEL